MCFVLPKCAETAPKLSKTQPFFASMEPPKTPITLGTRASRPLLKKCDRDGRAPKYWLCLGLFLAAPVRSSLFLVHRKKRSYVILLNFKMGLFQ